MTDKLLDVERSNAVAEQIGSKARASFENAYRAARAVAGSIYVQGFLVVGRQSKPLEHAWIELENCVIDPSLPHLNKKPESLYYFGAQRLTMKQLKIAIEEAEEDYPEDDPLPIYGAIPYEYYGDVMLGGKEYQTAHEAAIAQVKRNHQEMADRN